MAEIAGLLRSRTAPSAARERLFLGMEVVDQAYALEVGLVREILRIPRIYSLPKVPAFLKGVLDLRGAILPVVDFRERLGYGPVDLKKGRVVVASIGSTAVGLLVDAVVEVFAVPEEELKSPPPMVKGQKLEFIEAMVKRESRLYLVLAARSLFSAQEFASLEGAAWSKKT